MFEQSCTVEEKVLIHMNPKTHAGKDATLDGPLKVTVQAGDGTASVADDGVSFFAISPDTPGDTTYLVEGDADLGAGVQNIQTIVVLHANGALAANFGPSADAPVLK